MQVEHLYVVIFRTTHDDRTGMRLETEASAKSLFNKYKSKCGGVLLAQVDPFAKTSPLQLLRTTRADMPVPEKTKKALAECPVESVSAPKGASYRTKIGAYLVFHAEDEGQSIDPQLMAAMFKELVEPGKLKEVQKISLIGCNVVNQRTGGYPDTRYENRDFDQLMTKYNSPLASVSTMFGLMAALRAEGMNPAICGYDVPIFLGLGPLGDDGQPKKHGSNAGAQEGKIVHPIRKRGTDGKWIDSPDGIGDGRKLTFRKKKSPALYGVSDLTAENNEFRKLHKRVLRIDNSGKICFGLSGWSDK